MLQCMRQKLTEIAYPPARPLRQQSEGHPAAPKVSDNPARWLTLRGQPRYRGLYLYHLVVRYDDVASVKRRVRRRWANVSFRTRRGRSDQAGPDLCWSA